MSWGLGRGCLRRRARRGCLGSLQRLKARAVEPPQYHHRQNYVAIFAAHIEIQQGVVRDTPDEICDAVQVAVLMAALLIVSSRLESTMSSLEF